MKEIPFDENGNLIFMRKLTPSPLGLTDFAKREEQLDDLLTVKIISANSVLNELIEIDVLEQKFQGSQPDVDLVQKSSIKEDDIKDDLEVDVVGVKVEKDVLPFQNDLELALIDWETYGPHNQVFPKQVPEWKLMDLTEKHVFVPQIEADAKRACEALN